MNKHQAASLALSIAATALSGVAFADTTAVSERDYQLPKCAKPVASVVVGKITCKSAGCQASAQNTSNHPMSALLQLAAQQNGGMQSNFAGIGEGMGAMLTTVLKETGCFDIQEREAMDELARELALVGRKVEVQQADFMISGAITAISMSTERSSIGGGFIPIIGAFTRTTQTADVGMDMKIIDVARAKVVESKTFVANNETSSTKWGGAVFGGGVLGGGMSSIKGTPMEPIIRDVLARVASFASTKLVDLRVANAGPVDQTPQTAVPVQASAVVAVPAQ